VAISGVSTTSNTSPALTGCPNFTRTSSTRPCRGEEILANQFSANVTRADNVRLAAEGLAVTRRVSIRDGLPVGEGTESVLSATVLGVSGPPQATENRHQRIDRTPDPSVLGFTRPSVVHCNDMTFIRNAARRTSV